MFPEGSGGSDSGSAGSHSLGGRRPERAGSSSAHRPRRSPWQACNRAELSPGARCASAGRALAATPGGRGSRETAPGGRGRAQRCQLRALRPARPCEWPPAAAQGAIYLVSYPEWVLVERVVTGARHRAKRVWASSSSRSGGNGRQWEAGCKRTRNPGIVEPLTKLHTKCKAWTPNGGNRPQNSPSSLTHCPTQARDHSLWLCLGGLPRPRPAGQEEWKPRESGLGARPMPNREAEQLDGWRGNPIAGEMGEETRVRLEVEGSQRARWGKGPVATGLSNQACKCLVSGLEVASGLEDRCSGREVQNEASAERGDRVQEEVPHPQRHFGAV